MVLSRIVHMYNCTRFMLIYGVSLQRLCLRQQEQPSNERCDCPTHVKSCRTKPCSIRCPRSGHGQRYLPQVGPTRHLVEMVWNFIYPSVHETKMVSIINMLHSIQTRTKTVIPKHSTMRENQVYCEILAISLNWFGNYHLQAGQ